LQNAADSVLARRILENSELVGRIEVELIARDGGWSLSVSDDGIGMDEEILTDFLLRFGRSFWRSPAARRKFPELAASNYRSTGRYGVGFFSVFMLSDSVRVITKQFDSGQGCYRSLRFPDGLRGRPTVHVSAATERPRGYNTRVSVDLTEETASRMLLSAERFAYGLSRKSFQEGLFVLLQRLAAAFPVNLILKTSAGEEQVAKANDWISLDPALLIRRISDVASWMEESHPNYATNRWMFEAMVPIYPAIDEERSKPLGRLGIFPGAFMFAENLLSKNRYCAIVAGPFPAAHIDSFAGVIAGEPTRAARDMATVDVKKLDWTQWLEEQCDLMADGLCDASLAHQAGTASILLQLGGVPTRLFIFTTALGPLSLNTVGTWIEKRHKFTLHLRSSLPEALEPDEERDVIYGIEGSGYRNDRIEKVFKGLTPRRVPDLLEALCRQHWGKSRTFNRELSVGTWEFERQKE
jgi:hypothetical protein